MRLTEATVELRPRTSWEAIDLGVLLARKHRTLLMTSWAIVTVPVFLLLAIVFYDRPYLVALIVWWLKPLFERLPLLILSQALFGMTPTLKQALRAWPATLKTQLLPSLLWRRLSLSRSFLLPVQQLENLSGAQRAMRVEVLSRKDLGAARLLTLVGCHLETALMISMGVLLYALIPQQMDTDWLWSSLIDPQQQLNWLDHLNNVFYALVLVIWEPIYVACGFSLYLNRRTVLEAWDIELVFRRMRQRLIGSAYCLLIACSLALATAGSPAWADTSGFSCPIPEDESQSVEESPAAPNTPRLTHQALSSEAARQSIKDLVQLPPFRNPEQVSGWRLPERDHRNGQASGSLPDASFAKWLNWLMESGNAVARVFEVLLWALVIGLAGLLLWRYRVWFTAFVSRTAAPARPMREAPSQLFGLQVGAETLPDDIAASVERLWPNQPREALGLLYRALLSRLLTQYRLPLRSADTEGEVLVRVAALNLPALEAFARNLTHHWQNLAYGHRPPPADSQAELCDGWRRLFDDKALT
jgi:hypothetical protein